MLASNGGSGPKGRRGQVVEPVAKVEVSQAWANFMEEEDYDLPAVKKEEVKENTASNSSSSSAASAR